MRISDWSSDVCSSDLQAEGSDADMGGAPAGEFDEMRQHRRPERAGEIIAGGGQPDGETAPAGKPQRDIGDQRREHSRTADADKGAVEYGIGGDRQSVV